MPIELTSIRTRPNAVEIDSSSLVVCSPSSWIGRSSPKTCRAAMTATAVNDACIWWVEMVASTMTNSTMPVATTPLISRVSPRGR